MGLSLVYVFYGIVLIVFLVSEPTYRDENHGSNRNLNIIVEHLRSNFNNK